MKKSFPLQSPKKADARVRDSIKHEIRKYVQRERRKPLPVDFDEWEFRCRVGSSSDDATAKALKEISSAIDAVAETGATSVYVEIIAIATARPPAPPRHRRR
jgi:hypothetical protein